MPASTRPTPEAPAEPVTPVPTVKDGHSPATQVSDPIRVDPARQPPKPIVVEPPAVTKVPFASATKAGEPQFVPTHATDSQAITSPATPSTPE